MLRNSIIWAARFTIFTTVFYGLVQLFKYMVEFHPVFLAEILGASAASIAICVIYKRIEG